MERKPKRFRKFLKRLNRGVVLAIALIVVFVSYSIVDNAIFEGKDRGEIETLLREYGVDMIKVCGAPKGTNPGEPLTASEKDKMKASLEALVAEYYTDSKDSVIMYSSNSLYGSDTQNGVELIEKFDAKVDGTLPVIVESVELISMEDNGIFFNYNGINMSRKAGKYVHAYMQVSYEVTYITSEPDCMPFFLIGDSGYMGYEDIEGEKGELGMSEFYRVKARLTFSGTVKLIRVDGEWKIACTENIYAYADTTTKAPVKSGEVKIGG